MQPFHLIYPLAEILQTRFAEVCEPGQCVIAGSLRRKASAIAAAENAAVGAKLAEGVVKDIELLCYPTPGVSMFMEPTYERTPLYDLVRDLLADGTFAWGEDKKDGPRYKKLFFPAGNIYLDLFICFPPAQWGYQMAVRTGPWQYSKWLVTQRRYGGALPSYLKVEDAGLYNGRKLIPTPTEESFFQALGLLTPAPHERNVE